MLSVLIFLAGTSFQLDAGGVLPNTADDDAPECPICFDTYTEHSIVIQFDCNQPANHHFCLTCASDHIDHAKPCASCMNPHYTVHDPRIDKASCVYIHHRQTPLSAQEQQDLQAYLAKVGDHNLSQKPAPDTALRKCSVCKHEVAQNQVILELGCGHALCLNDAAQLVKANSHDCPICNNGPVSITDPLELNDQDEIVLKYLYRCPTKHEIDTLQTIRSCKNIQLYQHHIALNRRVPIPPPAIAPAAPTQPAQQSIHSKKQIRPLILIAAVVAYGLYVWYTQNRQPKTPRDHDRSDTVPA